MMDWWMIALITATAILTFPIWIAPAVIVLALMFAVFAYIGTVLGLVAALVVGIVLAPFVWSARLASAIIRGRWRRRRDE